MHGCNGASVGGGNDFKTFGKFFNIVRMTHPAYAVGRNAVKQFARPDLYRLFAVFAGRGAFNDSAKVVGEALHTVANAENGLARSKNRVVDLGCFFFVNTVRTAAENKSVGSETQHFFNGRKPW